MAGCSGREFLGMLETGCLGLRERRDEINALNVFPVPDGDTGTNMLLTVEAALKQARACVTNGIGDVAAAAAGGALRGARGNSGVILSQLMAGFADGFKGLQSAGVKNWEEAWSKAVKAAYGALLNPVEGTMLTVAREIGEALPAAAQSRPESLGALFTEAVKAGRNSLQKTPLLLPILKKAGVVDAGGMGLLVIWESFAGYLSGSAPAPETSAASRAAPAHAPGNAPSSTSPAGHALPATESKGPAQAGVEDLITFGYCTECLVGGSNLAPEVLRNNLVPLGDSLLVVGGGDLLRVHVHTDHPGHVIELCLLVGELLEVKVDNLRQQHRDLVAAAGSGGEKNGFLESAPVPAKEADPGAEIPSVQGELPPAALVVVSQGDGFREIFQSLGATTVVEGGQTANPSAGEILEAIESTGAQEVILLPNNPNIILAAEQAARLSSRPVHIVPTGSLQEGVSALLGFVPIEEPATCARKMTESARLVHTGAVTRAVRQADFGDLAVSAGDFIAVTGKDMVAAESSLKAALSALVGALIKRGGRLLTLFWGDDLTAEEVTDLAAEVSRLHPALDIEIYHGGQPLYPVLVSLE
ncbi:MAG: DAK2 domain-containing protein [Firmicutes bacterium]|nr:DAK2 domain-containing protein [Bacillota bacterium]